MIVRGLEERFGRELVIVGEESGLSSVSRGEEEREQGQDDDDALLFYFRRRQHFQH